MYRNVNDNGYTDRSPCFTGLLLGCVLHVALYLKKKGVNLMKNRIRHRNDLPLLIPANGIAVELGVAKGVYSETILAMHSTLLLHSVDRWAGDRNHDDKEFEEALERLSKYKERSCVMRMSFVQAVEQFKDESLDFVYIDGYAHTGQEDGQTLRDWYPKVKKGGIFAGHDFHPNFPLTVKIVKEFCEKNKCSYNLTETDQYPSWFVRK